MDAAQIASTTQEQAVASWIEWLNQLRFSALMDKLIDQDTNLEDALAELQKLKNFIGEPKHILGNSTTKHGEIAEQAQVYISNAKKLIEGLKTEYSIEGVGKTAPEDYLKNGLDVQSKFLNGIEKTLLGNGNADGIKQHLKKYPDFVKNGGTYEIPKDQYDKIVRIKALGEQSPSKLSSQELSFKLFKKIKQFEQETGLRIGKEVKPSNLTYQEVQQGNINKTIAKNERDIQKKDSEIRKAAFDASKPTLQEGLKTAGVSAAAEGGMGFCLGVVKKRREGKHLSEFTADDWKDVGVDTAKSTVKGGIRGGAVYAMTNFTLTPAAIANALVTAVYGTIAQAYKLRRGEISAEDFIVNSEVLCLDVSVSAVSSMLGQTIIPVPILGAIIGNVAGMFMYQIAKDHLSAKEQELISNYRESMASLEDRLERQYKALLLQLEAEFAKFSSIVDLAFDLDVNVAFDGSIQLADYVGVSNELVLRSKRDIDNYFKY